MENKKKVGILTIHNVDNYGAILQTFSTFNYLKKISSPEIINFDNPNFEASLKLIRYSGLSSIKSCIKDILRINSRFRFIKKFKEFSKQHLTITSKVSKKKLNSIDFLSNFDVLLVGSDQVWNPDITNPEKKINSDYFFNINTPEKLRKISFASSFGGKEFKKNELEQINLYLNKFYKISLREKNTISYLNIENKKKAEHVLDPVFLTEKKIWEQIACHNLKKIDPEINNYVLVYSVARSKLIKKITKYIKKYTTLKIITIDPNLMANTQYFKKISDAGPIEFLNLFMNSSFVVTDSFHGTCFSLIFEKKFVSIALHKHSDDRITDLLNNIGCKKNFILKPDEDDFKNLDQFEISEQSKVKLNDLILKSKTFLDQSILK